MAAVRRARIRASEEEISALKGDLHANGLSHVGKTVREVTVFDEYFHLALPGFRAMANWCAN
ncbi:MAG: hypothetical protein R3D29_06695 [Nitratireductor sp.]